MSSRGFTLIELLITTAIMGMLMFTGSYVYSMLSGRWDKELGEFEQTFDQAKNFDTLQRLFEGVMPYIVTQEGNNRGRPSFFFVGKQDSLLALTGNGLLNSERLEVFRLTVVENENDKYDLVLQLNNGDGMLLTSTEQEIVFDFKKTLFKDLDQVLFGYYGYENFQAKNLSSEDENVQAPTASWLPEYSGIERQLMPEKLGIVLVYQGKELSFTSELDENSQRFIEHYMSQQAES